jgi:hypothetical protein
MWLICISIVIKQPPGGLKGTTTVPHKHRTKLALQVTFAAAISLWAVIAYTSLLLCSATVHPIIYSNALLSSFFVLPLLRCDCCKRSLYHCGFYYS